MKLILPVVCAVLASCSSPQPVSPAPAVSAPVAAKPQPSMRTIEVESDPPGARIEVNEEYVGQAPCSIEVQDDGTGRFHERVVVRALPIHQGQQTQMKWFNGYGALNNPYLTSDRIPGRVFFDMSLVRVPREVNVNLRSAQ